jgi:hypothetical protein
LNRRRNPPLHRMLHNHLRHRPCGVAETGDGNASTSIAGKRNVADVVAGAADYAFG